MEKCYITNLLTSADPHLSTAPYTSGDERQSGKRQGEARILCKDASSGIDICFPILCRFCSELKTGNDG